MDRKRLTAAREALAETAREALAETAREHLDKVAREDKRRALTAILLQMNIQKIQQYQMRH